MVERALVEVAKTVSGEIQAARRVFRQILRDVRADVAAPREFVLALPDDFRFEVNLAIRILHRMDLRSTRDLTQLLFVVFAETGWAEPRELTLLWHAVQAYLHDISQITQHLPDQVLIPLPSSVFTLLNGFCEYHICESRRSGTSVGGSTQTSTTNLRDLTERFMAGMVSVEPSPISEKAMKAVIEDGKHEERNAIRKGACRVEERRYLPRSVRKFIEANRSTLNTLLYWDSTLLDSTLPYLKSEPSLIDFTFKLNEFRTRIDIESNPHIKIVVDRNRCLEDSFNALKKVKTFKAPLQVQFRNEEGADAGGLQREWFQLLSNAFVNESYALFIHTREGLTYQPNPFSDINASHLEYFHFVGLILGMAITHNVALDIHFTRAVYRHLIGVQPVFQDLSSVDPELHANLRWLLENDVSELGLSFAVSADRFGEVLEHDLQPGGRHLPVHNDNKAQYVRQLCEFHMTTRTAPQLTSLLTGFYTVIPREAIRMFTELELELVICGFVDYDVEDMRGNTAYQGYTAASPQVRWFWEVVGGMSKDDRANLLMFATGSSKLPLGGFAKLEGSGGMTQLFTIGRWSGSPELLPQAHTCFNKINLPEYPTAEILREKLMLAITYGHMGFGML
ncbi:unnamed protein product [Phytomonas sp. Hart1]|nr:unnamed protein product [Phytomonas sp. Hart1]|eukprot:CCW72097.1 unnamed protein product [Phytomonas sp. isolate Hart1]